MLGQNARKTTATDRQSRRSASSYPTDDRLSGLRSESPRRRPSRARSDGLIDDDESVLGVDLSLEEAMRSIVAAGVAGIHCSGGTGGGPSEKDQVRASDSHVGERGGGSATAVGGLGSMGGGSGPPGGRSST